MRQNKKSVAWLNQSGVEYIALAGGKEANSAETISIGIPVYKLEDKS